MKTLKEIISRAKADGYTGKELSALVFECVKTQRDHANNSQPIYDLAIFCATRQTQRLTGLSWNDLPDGNELDQATEADTWDEFKDAVKDAVRERLEAEGAGFLFENAEEGG